VKSGSVEYLRILGFAGVVLLHVNSFEAFAPFNKTGFLIDEASRFAVPAFFMISGYFSKELQRDTFWPFARKLAVRTLTPFLFFLALYFALNIAGLFGRQRVWEWDDILRSLISGGPAPHLWFLPALLIGSILFAAGRLFLSRWQLWVVVIGLYCIGVFLGTYAHLLGHEYPLLVSRNGLFFAPIFLAIGAAFRQHEISDVNAALLAILGFAIHTLEGLFVAGGYPLGHDMSFGTVLLSIGVAAPFFSRVKYGELPLSSWGADVLGAYLIHLIILRTILEIFPSEGLLYGLLVATATFIISFGLSRAVKAVRPLAVLVS